MSPCDASLHRPTSSRTHGAHPSVNTQHANRPASRATKDSGGRHRRNPSCDQHGCVRVRRRARRSRQRGRFGQGREGPWPTFIGTTNSDILNADDGITSGNDTVYGGDGNDTIRGLGGDDDLYGEDGRDTIYGGDGIDGSTAARTTTASSAATTTTTCSARGATTSSMARTTTITSTAAPAPTGSMAATASISCPITSRTRACTSRSALS